MNNNFLAAEAAWLEAPEPVEPEIEDLEEGKFGCEHEGCDRWAVALLDWPLEDHDYPSGFFCQEHLDKILEEI